MPTSCTRAYRRFKDRPRSIRAQFWCVEEPDYIFHRVVPDLVISPTLDPLLPEVAGAIVSFGVNKYWSFQSPQHKRALSEAWRFLVLLLASYALSLTLFSALTWSGIVPYLAKLATDTICFFFNFLVMRWWVYRRGELALRFVPQERAR
jgi:GtrA-like protein